MKKVCVCVCGSGEVEARVVAGVVVYAANTCQLESLIGATVSENFMWTKMTSRTWAAERNLFRTSSSISLINALLLGMEHGISFVRGMSCGNLKKLLELTCTQAHEFQAYHKSVWIQRMPSRGGRTPRSQRPPQHRFEEGGSLCQPQAVPGRQ